MRPLSLEARSLIEAAGLEAADEPTAADRVRVQRLLMSGLSGTAAGSAASLGLGTAKAAKLAFLSKLILPVVVGTAAAGTGSYYAYQAYRRAQAPSVSQPANSPARASHGLGSPARPGGPSLPAVGAPLSATRQGDAPHGSDSLMPVPDRRSTTLRSTDRNSVRARPGQPGARAQGNLQQETHLLRQVHSEIRNGQGKEALARLREYDQRFGEGVLRAEHHAARVLALCQMGETGKARVEAERFLSRWPSSPLAPRVRDACIDR